MAADFVVISVSFLSLIFPFSSFFSLSLDRGHRFFLLSADTTIEKWLDVWVERGSFCRSVHEAFWELSDTAMLLLSWTCISDLSRLDFSLTT